MRRPTAVISDFGGVLTNPLSEAFTAWQDGARITLEELGRAMEAATRPDGENPLFELEKGLVSEEEFRQRLERHLGGRRIERFGAVYFEHLHPNEPLIAHMRELRARGVRMGLLTNNVREWEPLWRAKLPDVEEIFEVIVDSAFVGMRKPERGIYELTLDRLGLEAADCVFLDDLQHNVDAADELGMRGILYRSAEQAIEEIEAALAG